MGAGRVTSAFSSSTGTGYSASGSQLSLGLLGLGWEGVETQEEARAIGRVLTPESDPFRKTDVSLVPSRSISVMAESFESVVDMEVSSGEGKVTHGLRVETRRLPTKETVLAGGAMGRSSRRYTNDSSSGASELSCGSVSASGHAHTNSGDTITPLTVMLATGVAGKLRHPASRAGRRSLQPETFSPEPASPTKYVLDERHRRARTSAADR